mmetsp:Transcript_42070/g.96437  ORF Transcript_42070/g.96437 Transcript_42070/m.96437 type:complete len:492 (+) Transcript_42070:1865-3340(+)
MVKDRNRHAPRALPRDAPVGAALRHCRDAVAPQLGHPAHLSDRTQRLLTEGVDRGEPLRGGAEDGGLLRAPVVRVLVLVRLLAQQRARLGQSGDHLAVAVGQHVHPHEPLARLLREPPGVVDGREQRQPVLLSGEVVVLPVPRRRVHQPRAALCGDVIAPQHHLTCPLEQRVGVRRAGDLLALERRLLREALPVGEAEPAAHRADEVLGDEKLEGERGVGGDGVLEGAVHGHREVGGDGPRRGGPDRHPQAVLVRLERRRRRDHLEAHVDGGGGVLLRVLQLRLREGGPAGGRPVHRLAPAVDVALEVHLSEHAELRRLVLGLQREVRRVEVAPHAVPHERVALARHRLPREARRPLAQLQRRELSPLAGLHRLQHLQLNRQAVAVPAGDVGGLPPLQQHVPVDDVLQDLVERVAHVQLAVGVRRPVVKHERLAGVGRRQLRVDLLVGPELLELGLARERVGALREGCVGEQDGGAVRRILRLLTLLAAEG